MKISKYYTEKEISLRKFLDLIEPHEETTIQQTINGEKIWKYIKDEISKTSNENNFSGKGITSWERRNISSLFSSMDELIRLLSKDKKNYKEYLQLLQEAAIAIGENLDTLIGEGSKAVEELERLCETVYEIFSRDNEINENEVSELSSISEKTKARVSDIPAKMEVVFFPYKYSMWDALESVYEAALKDSETKVHVAPLPYIERGEDESAIAQKYELSSFLAAGIPAEICTEIDLESLKPDAIFIHNAYDDVNIVTSVPKEYYSKELKKYTKHLVYIPYNLFGDDYVREHFVRIPGVVNANHVMLQSEKVKDRFVEVYKELLKEGGIVNIPKEQTEKFVNLGSPKMDYAIKAFLEPPKLPKEWIQLIGEGKDRKKIVFLCSHLRHVMESSGEYFIKKMDAVMDEFESREDMVLFWRPHPLSRQTATAMNPNIVSEYDRIVMRAKNGKNIIFDETDDYRTGFAASDAFYGSYTSLCEQYFVSGRPILNLNERING